MQSIHLLHEFAGRRVAIVLAQNPHHILQMGNMGSCLLPRCSLGLSIQRPLPFSLFLVIISGSQTRLSGSFGDRAICSLSKLTVAHVLGWQLCHSRSEFPFICMELLKAGFLSQGRWGMLTGCMRYESPPDHKAFSASNTLQDSSCTHNQVMPTPPSSSSPRFIVLSLFPRSRPWSFGWHRAKFGVLP
jgi:hypothetical protein